MKGPKEVTFINSKKFPIGPPLRGGGRYTWLNFLLHRRHSFLSFFSSKINRARRSSLLRPAIPALVYLPSSAFSMQVDEKRIPIRSRIFVSEFPATQSRGLIHNGGFNEALPSENLSIARSLFTSVNPRVLHYRTEIAASDRQSASCWELLGFILARDGNEASPPWYHSG